MPESLLQGGDRHPCIEQARRIRMPQAMGTEPNADGGPPALHATGDAVGRECTPALHEEMIGAGGFSDREVRPQRLNRPWAQVDEPVPLELGVPDAQPAGGEIDVLTAQSHELATPQPGIDQQVEDGQIQSSLPRGMHACGPRRWPPRAGR